MPIFARTKLVLQEDCYREKPERVHMKYVGPHVTKLYYKAYELLKAIFRASDSDIEEERYHWGKGEKEKFKVRWYLIKDMDVYTYLYVRVDVAGSGNEKSGNATIRLKPVIRTEYPQDTLWQRSLFYEMMRVFWHRAFYHEKREAYAEECRSMCIRFQREMNEFFKQLREEA
jgi:hypothetical protein